MVKMKEFKLSFNILIISFITIPLLLTTACLKNDEITDKKLIRFIDEYMTLVIEQNRTEFMNRIASKKFYIENIYPETVVKATINAWPGEDYWRTFFMPRRNNAINEKFSFYNGLELVKIKKYGKPKEIHEYKDFILYRRIPLTIIVKNRGAGNSTAWEIIDDDLMGVVVKQDGDFRLVNVLR